MKKLLIIPLLILLVLGGFFYARYYFVFGEGVKSGELNYVVNKGYIFKTYEGKMIQEGFKSTPNAGSIQSNEFTFSVEDEQIAEKLKMMGGRQIDVFYREYLHAIPWRGNSEFIVDSFVVKLENIALDYTSLTLYIGQDKQLKATLYPNEVLNKTIRWSSSDENIVVVSSNGQITAKSIGNAIIYATVENKTASCSVNVLQATSSLPQAQTPIAIESQQAIQ